MAKVFERQPKIITLEYRQEKDDLDYGSCMWASFYFDTEEYSMSILSDCGNYSYGWHPTPKSESFLHLLGRLGEGYLLEKLADRTFLDSKATFENVMEYLNGIAEEEGVGLDESEREDIKSACNAYSESGCFHQLENVLAYTELHDKYGDYEIYECIETTEPPAAKKIVEVFMNHIQPMIRQMESRRS